LNVRTTLTGISLSLAAAALVACGASEPSTIEGTNPPIDAAVCNGDTSCESDMRELSHKLEPSDDANDDGIIDQEELDAARRRLDEEEAAASAREAASASSAAAASSSRAEAEASQSSEAEAERSESERSQAESKEDTESEPAHEQEDPEPAPEPQEDQAEQAPQESPKNQGPPPLEWATLGPYASLSACEDTRAKWPVNSHPCYTGPDGKAYFEGQRQALQ